MKKRTARKAKIWANQLTVQREREKKENLIKKVKKYENIDDNNLSTEKNLKKFKYNHKNKLFEKKLEKSIIANIAKYIIWILLINYIFNSIIEAIETDRKEKIEFLNKIDSNSPYNIIEKETFYNRTQW